MMDAVSPPPVNKIQWYEKPLIMALRDIVKEYREAKNPKKQIDILADLNHTKGCRIAWLLDRCGEEVDKTKLPRKGRNADAPDLDLIWRDTPLGTEAAQINMERKHKIMEEKTMNKEMTLCREGFLESPLVMDDHKTNVSPNYQHDVTAQLWDVYLSRRRSIKALDTNDVRLMLKLAEVAREMTE